VTWLYLGTNFRKYIFLINNELNIMNNTKCPICSSKKSIKIHDQVNIEDKTGIYECKKCDLQFLDTWDNVEYVKSLYEGDKYIFTHNVEETNNSTLKYNEYDVRYDRLKPYLKKDSTLLEIGCGDGTFLKMIRGEVAVAEGIELSPPQVKKVRSEGLVCFDQMVGELEVPRQYDIICMFAVLEHIPLVKDFLQELKKYMHKDTCLFLEVPNRKNVLFNSYDIGPFKNFYYRAIHLYYFTPHSLEKLLRSSGFDVETSTSQQSSITNHIHWMYENKGQLNANYMTSVVLPVNIGNNSPLNPLWNELDDLYRKGLEDLHLGDLLSARVTLT
jgi:2-polyprenyl-3-methyl-5-hydroxy-6-metoxy-1,4-benzoquinol methylase